MISYISQLDAFLPKIALGHGPYDCKRKQTRTGSDTKWSLSKSQVLAFFLCGQLTCNVSSPIRAELRSASTCSREPSRHDGSSHGLWSQTAYICIS